MKTYSEQEIYKFVFNFYKNKGLELSEFSNRLYAIKRIVLHENSMRDVMEFLDMREHWWEFEKNDKARLKSKTRSQFKTILKSMRLELAKDGLKALE